MRTLGPCLTNAGSVSPLFGCLFLLPDPPSKHYCHLPPINRPQGTVDYHPRPIPNHGTWHPIALCRSQLLPVPMLHLGLARCRTSKPAGLLISANQQMRLVGLRVVLPQVQVQLLLLTVDVSGLRSQVIPIRLDLPLSTSCRPSAGLWGEQKTFVTLHCLTATCNMLFAKGVWRYMFPAGMHGLTFVRLVDCCPSHDYDGALENDTCAATTLCLVSSPQMIAKPVGGTRKLLALTP